MRSPEIFEDEDMVRVVVLVEYCPYELCDRNGSNVSCAAQFAQGLAELANYVSLRNPDRPTYSFPLPMFQAFLTRLTLMGILLKPKTRERI